MFYRFSIYCCTALFDVSLDVFHAIMTTLKSCATLVMYMLAYVCYVLQTIVKIMGVASNRQKKSIASSWNWPNKKTTMLINCVICRKPRGGRPGYDSDQGRKFLFPSIPHLASLLAKLYFNHKNARNLVSWFSEKLLIFWLPDIRF